MRISEKMGLVYTALFLTVSVAVITTNSDSVMAKFRGEVNVKAVDDIFTVQAGRDQRLFVLRNDVNAGKIPVESIRLISQPDCGSVSQAGSSFVYASPVSCTGHQVFRYCLFSGAVCEAASVALRLMDGRDPVATIETGPAVDVPGLAAQVEINQGDLEIANVHLGRTAPGEITVLPVSGAKLARVAVDTSVAFQRPERPGGGAEVNGTFAIDRTPRNAAAAISQVAEVRADADTASDISPEPEPGLSLPRDPAAVARAAVFPALGGVVRADTGFATPQTQSEIDQSPFGTPCGLDLSARAVPGAMIELTLNAPCHPNARVEISHARLTIAVSSGHAGLLKIEIPAFESKSRIAVQVAGAPVLSTRVSVPDMADFERVAIQWQGDFDLGLHALEFGASEGSAGHVWQGRRGGGYTMRLGDPGLDDRAMAEIYTLPHKNAARASGIVELLVAAAGSAETCGSGQVVRSFHSRSGRLVGASGVQFRLPDCGSGPQSLVLKNAVRDLIIAAR
ncbi:MAG: hypothetical protein K8F59_05435 [Rhodobacteraceae bacterium]|nr:hypothetical protein [Paracoccaceae bacterium]